MFGGSKVFRAATRFTKSVRLLAQLIGLLMKVAGVRIVIELTELKHKLT